MRKPIFSKYLLAILLVLFLLLIPARVKASLFDDFINQMNHTLQESFGNATSLVNPIGDKNIKDKKLSIDSSITLASGGDVNKNGQIDAGDTITFTYTFTNQEDKVFSFLTLETNIQKDKLNYIRNISGATGLSIKDNKIYIPNISLLNKQKLIVKFDATMNFSETDEVIFTEPELLDGNLLVIKRDKIEIRPKGLKGIRPSMLNTKNK